MALTQAIKDLLNRFADSQPALRSPRGAPYAQSNPQLGTVLDAALDADGHTAVIPVTYQELNAAGTGVAKLFGDAIPDNAIIERVWYEVLTAFSGNGDDASTIKLGLEDQDDDVKAASALGTGWTAGIKEGIQVGTAATMLKLSANRRLAGTWTAGGTDTALDAGVMNVYVRWAPGT